MSPSGDMREFDPGEYDRWWRENPDPNPLPYLPFPQPHHGDPDPEFVAVCEAAESVGARVELDVSAKAFELPERSDTEPPARYRNLVALHVRSALPASDTRVTERFGVGESVASVARRVRARLGAA